MRHNRQRPFLRHHRVRGSLRLMLVPLLSLSLLTAWPGPAAGQTGKIIVLPGATSAEGIAARAGNTFYAGDLCAGSRW